MHLAQQKQDITGQVSQGAIALLIFLPAPIDFSPIERESLGVPCSFGVLFWQGIPFLLIAGNLLLELVNLSAGTSLSAIERTRIQEKWSPHLLAVFIDSRCGQQGMDAPICSKDPFNILPGGQRLLFHFDNEI